MATFFILANKSIDLLLKKIKSTFAFYQPGYRSDLDRKGKSGQHRATHRLRAGFLIYRERDRATENYRSSLDMLRQDFDKLSLTEYDKRGVRLKT